MAVRIWRGVGRTRFCHAGAFRNARSITVDSRNRLSNIWAPTTKLVETEPREPGTGELDEPSAPRNLSYEFLARSGFLRQVQSGVFHLLPLGLRVQNKLEALIDKHMSSIGAAKVSLSSISTEALWKKTGRYSANSELFRIKDRRESGFLLAPTHEEEITSIVAGTIKSYKDLPLRLYQIGRKYRDERRPRNGLLRAKEFMMKDLYTFDSTHAHALETYEAVRAAYNRLFDELKIPYTVAEADSGNMGGKLSHEYHFIHSSGEDKIWSCSECKYVANEELVEHKTNTDEPFEDIMTFTAISADHTTRINLHAGVPKPKHTYNELDWTSILNPHAVRKAAETLSTSLATGLEPSTLKTLLPKTTQTINIYDIRLRDHHPEPSNPSTASYDITAINPGDACARCETGLLNPQPGIEVGHTFHLGTRYSEPLNALIATPSNTERVPVHMGCHGIGVSRLIGAIAAMLHDDKGLNWPRAIAPFEVMIAAVPGTPDEDINAVYDSLRSAGIDVVLDDRVEKSLGWKLKDADMVGYPVIVVLGKAWKGEGRVEVQCRRLGVRELVGEYGEVVGGVLGKL